VLPDGAIDVHPLLREYFAMRLQHQHRDAWRVGHRRLFHHLCSNTKEGSTPSLADLQPLYQAVAHGCLGGVQERACAEVYEARIMRMSEAYSMKKLGANGANLSALACFFETPWHRISSKLTNPAAEAWLLSQAAICLRALGRLNEALPPMRAGAEIDIKSGRWIHSARNTSNLSELMLALGQIDEALRGAEQALIYAERSEDWSMQMLMPTIQADALHQAGRLAEANELFTKSEALQYETYPDYELLYSVQGFRYCDLLLTMAERSAWLACLQCSSPSNHAKSLADVEQRATKTLKLAQDNNSEPLDIALNHLTLGRVALYKAVLQNTTLGSVSPALGACGHIAVEISRAVDGLRHANTQHYIPRALLTRAWLRCLQGKPTGPDSAQTDLDEAWEIAERGPMPLFLADIHLHRARLFFREKNYPWSQHTDGSQRGPQDDLAEARRLIEKHGYWRRKEELEDAEAALAHWTTLENTPALAT
jgi:tetratricopeptide (TPR) repeat protein